MVSPRIWLMENGTFFEFEWRFFSAKNFESHLFLADRRFWRSREIFEVALKTNFESLLCVWCGRGETLSRVAIPPRWRESSSPASLPLSPRGGPLPR